MARGRYKGNVVCVHSATYQNSCLVGNLCVTVCNPMDCSPPGSSVHGIFQARIVEWVAFPSSGDLPDAGINPTSSELAGRFFTMNHQGRPYFLVYYTIEWRRKWQPTPVFLPGESLGWGAWWAAVYGVTQSRTRLKRLSSSSSSSLWVGRGSSPTHTTITQTV